MNSLVNIRKAVGYRLLNNLVHKIDRLKTFHNFDSAKTVGVLFNATSQDTFNAARSFLTYLGSRNIKFYGLGYVKTNEIISYFPHIPGVSYYSLNDVNWYLKPKGPSIEEFMRIPMDMLIDISIEEQFTTQYIFALSKAKIKIAKQYRHSNFADLMIDVKETDSVVEFIDHIKHYLFGNI